MASVHIRFYITLRVLGCEIYVESCESNCSWLVGSYIIGNIHQCNFMAENPEMEKRADAFLLFSRLSYWVDIIRKLQLKELQPWGGRQWQLRAGKEESRAARRRRGGIWESVIWCQGNKRVYGIRYDVWYQSEKIKVGVKRSRSGWKYQDQGENIKVRVIRGWFKVIESPVLYYPSHPGQCLSLGWNRI